MNLKELRAKGAFVSAEPVKRDLSWTHTDGDVEVTDQFSVWVKKHSFGTIERVFVTDKDDQSRSALLISESVFFGDEGKERISYVDAYQLDPSLAGLLMAAITEVNGLGDKQKN